jgi:hypothetical protein
MSLLLPAVLLLLAAGSVLAAPPPAPLPSGVPTLADVAAIPDARDLG